MSDVVRVTVDWLASTGAPNAVVVVALLTHPAVWSSTVVDLARRRFGGGRDE